MSTLKFMVEIEPAPGTRLLCTQDQLGEGLITLMRSLLTV